MRFTIALISLATLPLASSASTDLNCENAIGKHIDEAISYNKSVFNKYNKLTDGRSLPLSISLISFEKLSKLYIYDIDQKAELYRKNGIPLLCDELGDMAELPAFQNQIPTESRPQILYKFNYNLLKKEIKILLSKDKIQEAYSLVATQLNNLERFPNQQCLTRHFLESIARTLLLSSTHQNDAKKLGLPDSINISKSFVSTQLKALAIMELLDKKAFKLQREGYLIYCQDIPPINWK